MESYPRIKADELRSFTKEVFVRSGMPAEDAAIAADILVETDLRGIDSHGVAHLGGPFSYAEELKSGLHNLKPRIRTIRETTTTALVDGDNGFGLIVAYRAMELAIRKAKEAGIAMVTVTNSHHFGASQYYSTMALPHDMIGLSMTNCAAQVVPTHGSKPMLGTNPLSFAVPAGKESPYVLDMATSAVAFGKLEIAQRKGVSIPQGWAVDKDGNLTTDPKDGFEGGALLPLGSSAELGSYKGYGLAVLVDILAGVLSGMGYSATLSEEDGKMGHFFGAIRIDGFRPVDEFKAMMDDMLATLRATPPAPGKERVLVPGQIEHETKQERSRQGIPLHPEVLNGLKEQAQKLGVDSPLEQQIAG